MLCKWNIFVLIYGGGEGGFHVAPVTLPYYLSFQPDVEWLQRYQQQCTTPVDMNRRHSDECYWLVYMKCYLPGKGTPQNYGRAELTDGIMTTGV